ncbi:Probable RNA-directed DNA polymerase from transposon BS [Eumeta japonica]|uniref:Probable RNA-directed DNA polymerase from transposon BS n=1 Tax=Eumeta variegata TaxID=151549 RepID=A0A4C1SH77_EUMVA|nr:Probable RNA-directed DNA polymerase from transposon BS [Eumeta japonica]
MKTLDDDGKRKNKDTRARALQREVKARVREFRNESWSDLMEEIKPSHKAFWAVTKALKTVGYTPIPPLKKPDNSVAIDDAEIAECLADSIETQCSHASPPHDIAHISRIEEEVLQNTSLEPKDDLAPVSLSEVQTLVKSFNTRKAPGLDGIHKPGKPRDLPVSYRPISLLSGLGKLFEKILKTRLSDHLLGKSLIIDEQFGFRPAHSCPQQVLRLVKYVSEGFETERSTVVVFFDVAKAFDRIRHADISHLSMSALTRQDVYQSRSSSRLHPPPLLYSAYTNDISRPSSFGVQLALFADDTALFYGSRNRSTRFTLLPLQRAIDELGQWFRKWRIEVNPISSHTIQVRVLELPTITKYMKDTSKRFFDIAGSHSNALLRAAVDCQPPPPTHLIRRLRNVLTDPPNALTAAVESLNDVNDTHDYLE